MRATVLLLDAGPLATVLRALSADVE